jgi:ABC-type antimicrobial peptide transport system permease subunit
MGKGLILTASGVAAGGFAALQLTRLMGYLLYKVSPHDPLAFGAALAIVALGALAACVVPGWRATRTDPIQALRS